MNKNCEKADQKWLTDQLDYLYAQVMKNLADFEYLVPAAVSEDNHYPAVANRDWTDGFWSGILQLANQYQPDQRLITVIEKQLGVFQERLVKKIVLNHHDLGFLYTLSAGVEYQRSHNELAKQMLIDAADILMQRYHQKAGILQAWGQMNDPNQSGRLIIDSTMNLPLLYQASILTQKNHYYLAASHHIKVAQKYIMRPDHSTYHTFFMDVETGAPRFGSTSQGYADDSCWARGQAWAIYGFALSYRYTGDRTLLVTAKNAADYFIAHSPADHVAFWDLVFTDGSTEERDTSAAAIAASGLLELSQHLPVLDDRRQVYENFALKILKSLANNYSTKSLSDSNGFLTQGVYSKPGNNGVNECTIWGDYFYFEALLRVYQSWRSFW